MNFSDLLKSIDHQRDQERLDEAENTRASDLDREMGSMATGIVDTLIAQRAVPLANNLMQVYEEVIKGTYTQERAIYEWCRLQQELTVFRQRIIDEINEALGEIHQVLIERGIKPQMEQYIRMRLDGIVAQLEENCRSSAEYVAARLRWLISGEEDAMSLEEFKARRELEQ